MRLWDLFAAAVAQHGERVAVDVPPGRQRPQRQRVTYRELAAMAASVRTALAERVQGEAFVVVFLPRGTAWLPAVQLGVLLAGAAHVCLDPSFPRAHLQHVVRDAKAVAIVTDADGEAHFAGLGVPVLTVPRDVPAVRADAVLPQPPPWSTPRSLAYAIYTSGTTGAPKAVLIEHAGVVNLITQGVQRFRIGPEDRVVQGSSPAYDSSIEESWLALASGATMLVLDDEMVRAGPDLVPWLRAEEATVFCPPPTLLRAMDLAEPRRELPRLRLCYVGGEPLTADLADLWGRELWLENGYGPTECTVTVVRGRVQPGRPVTIGTPVPPHRAFVLDERLQPVADGEAGELCLAGPGLARGYLNQPELTAAKFPELPGIGRVYRTGDLVVRQPDGEISYHGRIDAQIKVRGYRIELEAIESVLARDPAVREVACCAQGDEPARLIAAHVVPADAEALPDFAALAAAVRAVLPAYCVPQRFGLCRELPRTVGGKLDRKKLPVLAAPADDVANENVDGPVGDAALPSDPLAQRLWHELAAVLRLPFERLHAGSDFFALGGDSLRAALLVSRLRKQPGGEAFTVRDVYEGRTLGALAATLRARAEAPAATVQVRDEGRVEGRSRPMLATVVQVAFLLALLLVVSSATYVLGFVIAPALLATFTLTELLLIGPWLAALGFFSYAWVALWVAVIGKELLIGRYRAVRTPAWSGLHLRHWLVVRLVRLVPWSLFEGTEAKSMALRALGARIGKRVHIHRGVDVLSGGWDLLEIGDDVTLGREVHLGVAELDAGHLVLGPVRIGAGATFATRAGCGADVEVGAGALVQPLSYVAAGSRVGAGQAWDGVPARAVGAAPAVARDDVAAKELSPWLYTVVLLGLRFVQAPVAALPFTALVWLCARWAGADGAGLVQWLCGAGPSSQPAWWWATVLFAVLAVPLGLLAQAAFLRWSPKIPAGTHPRWSWLHLRLQVRSEVIEAAGLWLSGTLFWPAWLRLAGMRIGRDCEVSTILDVLPEQVSLGGGSFLADGIYLGVPHQHQGRVTVAPAAFGERTFVGNHVVLPAGERLADGIVLGVSTVASAATMPAETGWFGQPAMQLHRREVVVADRRLTHEPGLLRYANRVFWEALRVLLPTLPVALALWWFDQVALAHPSGWLQGTAVAAWATFVFASVLALVVLGLKWLLLGRVRPGQHGLWSCWASRWDFHYVVWQRYGRALLQPLEGTLLLPWFLRAMGMRIGRLCVLGDGFAQVVDPDMLTLEDGATVHAMFQAHSFEDRVLKIDHVRIGRGSSVGCGTVVLYGADVGDGAHVLSHSVVMKGEVLLPGRRYAGAPAEPLGAARARATPVPGIAPPPPPPSPPSATAAAPTRQLAFDVARGFAVLGMIWLHFVPEPKDGEVGLLAALAQHSIDALEGLPAALFVLLAGMAWSQAGLVDAGGERLHLRPAFVWRRAFALAAIGLPLWQWLWPNDVLTPMAMMLVLSSWLLARGRLFVTVVVAAMTAAAPVLVTLAQPIVQADWLDDGTHRANHEVGLATLRWYTFDGTYPLLPWLVLPLLGALLAIGGRGDASRWRRWIWCSLPLPAIAYGLDAFAHAYADELGDVAAPLYIEWQPTSVPFLLRNGGLAVATVAFLLWWQLRRGLPRWTAPFALIGRASLTHYLLHIALVYEPMRHEWPNEDWGVAVGLQAALGYAVLAWPLSWLWFRWARRGPIEALLARLAGPTRP
ncbi:MAG: amino acid adenylation domain-containing protein [Planctomycetota bacterium]|jgi:non-ribosomal peptide synthetase-like protein